MFYVRLLLFFRWTASISSLSSLSVSSTDESGINRQHVQPHGSKLWSAGPRWTRDGGYWARLGVGSAGGNLLGDGTTLQELAARHDWTKTDIQPVSFLKKHFDWWLRHDLVWRIMKWLQWTIITNTVMVELVMIFLFLIMAFYIIQVWQPCNDIEIWCMNFSALNDRYLKWYWKTYDASWIHLHFTVKNIIIH